MSHLLHFAEHRLQETALLIMAIVYTIRVIWLTRFKAGKERQANTGNGDTSPRKGIIYSWANIAMPWAMESTRTKFTMYLQFTVFHLGVVAAIALSFIIPYAPAVMESTAIVALFQVVIGAAFCIGVYRIIRRIGHTYIRAISSPDDYFSLILLTVWFFFAFWSVPNDISNGETILLTYFFLTAFFLIYVPFSKISHYLYYPFTRYYIGKTLGKRGVYPIKRVPARAKN
jgi:nitrate reductase gamma subunit